MISTNSEVIPEIVTHYPHHNSNNASERKYCKYKKSLTVQYFLMIV